MHTPPRHRKLLTLTLGVLFSAVSQSHAQTLIDTAVSTGISTQLDTTQTQSGGILSPARLIDSARKAAALMQGSVTEPNASAAASAATPGLPVVVPPPPITPELAADLSAAAALIDQGKPQDAQAAYEKLVSQNYNQPAAHFGLGVALAAQGNAAGARFEFNEVARLDPKNALAPFNLGVLARQQAGTTPSPEALTDFTQAAGLARATFTPAALRPLLDALAQEQARTADQAGLSATLNEIHTLFPADTDVTFSLARSLAASQGPLALTLLYPLRQTDPGNGEAARLTARIFAAQGLTSRAEHELNVALPEVQEGSERALIQVDLAQLQRTHALKSAITSAEGARQSDPNLAQAAALLAQLYTDSGQLTLAATQWKDASHLDKHNAAYLTNLAQTELNNGQPQLAGLHARAALREIAPPALQARALFVLGVAQAKQGQDSGAHQALSSSAALAPSAQTSLWLGTVNFKSKDYQGAATQFAQSLSLQPSNDARIGLASALIQTGRASEAEAAMKTQVSLTPKSADAWYLLGLSRRLQRNENGARSALKTASLLGDSRAAAALKIK